MFSLYATSSPQTCCKTIAKPCPSPLLTIRIQIRCKIAACSRPTIYQIPESVFKGFFRTHPIHSPELGHERMILIYGSEIELYIFMYMPEANSVTYFRPYSLDGSGNRSITICENCFKLLNATIPRVSGN